MAISSERKEKLAAIKARLEPAVKLLNEFFVLTSLTRDKELTREEVETHSKLGATSLSRLHLTYRAVLEELDSSTLQDLRKSLCLSREEFRLFSLFVEVLLDAAYKRDNDIEGALQVTVGEALDYGVDAARRFVHMPTPELVTQLEEAWYVLARRDLWCPATVDIGAQLTQAYIYQQNVYDAERVVRRLDRLCKFMVDGGFYHSERAKILNAKSYVIRRSPMRTFREAMHWADTAEEYASFVKDREVQGVSLCYSLKAWAAAATQGQDRDVCGIRRKMDYYIAQIGRTLGDGTPMDGLERRWFHAQLVILECCAALGWKDLTEKYLLVALDQSNRKGLLGDPEGKFLRSKSSFAIAAAVCLLGNRQNGLKLAREYVKDLEFRWSPERQRRIGFLIHAGCECQLQSRIAVLATVN